MKRNGYKFVAPSLARSQSRRSRKPGLPFYIPAPSPPHTPSSPPWRGIRAGNRQRRQPSELVVALDYCLVQRWTYLGAFKGKRTFSSLPGREGGKEGAGGREGRASWKSTWRGGRSPIPRGKRLRMKKKSSALPSRSAPCSMDSIGYLARVWQRESEMRGGAGERGDMSLVPYMTCGMCA